jgi:hypothetical protein
MSEGSTQITEYAPLEFSGPSVTALELEQQPSQQLLDFTDMTSLAARFMRVRFTRRPPAPGKVIVGQELGDGIDLQAAFKAVAVSDLGPAGAVFEIDRSHGAEATPTSIALNLARLEAAKLAAATKARILALAMRRDGWRGPGSRALGATSLSTFLKFWGLIAREAAEPELALMPNGHLSAEWFKNSRRHIDLEFADDTTIYCGLFNGSAIWEGKDDAQNIATMLKGTASKPLLWR